MHKSELYVGQRVYVPLGHTVDGNSSTTGKEGTIVAVYANGYGYDMAVDFDEVISGGYNCGGVACDGHGYKGHAQDVEELLEDVDVPSEIEISFSDLIAIRSIKK